MNLLVLDGNSIVNRAFYGIKLLTTKSGYYTNAIYGFLNILLKLQDTCRFGLHHRGVPRLGGGRCFGYFGCRLPRQRRHLLYCHRGSGRFAAGPRRGEGAAGAYQNGSGSNRCVR